MSITIPLLHIVEDNELDRMVFRKQMLAAATVEAVQEHEEGEAAKAFLHSRLQSVESLPQLILIDVHLPGTCDGWELLAWIRQQEALAHTKVVMFTSSPQLQTRPHEFVADPDATIHAKPLTQDMANSIATWFQAQR
ncbi:MAG: response regulator [Oceanococcaceae bacterium]